MGKLAKGKELENLVRLTRYFGGTNPFGRDLTELGASQVDALVEVVNQEIREAEDRAKGPNTQTFRFDEKEWDEDFPEVI